MTCPRCNGLVICERIFAENYFIDDIFCFLCGERFYPDGVEKGIKLRERAEIELSNNFKNSQGVNL